MLDFCGWSNAPPLTNRKQVLWTRNSGETLSDNSGPEKDHTTDSEEGWYVYVPLDAQPDGVAILQSELLGPIQPQYCFGFFYHIFTAEWEVAPKLTVLYQSVQLGSPILLGNISSSFRDRWQQFNVTVTGLPMGRFQLKTFEGQSSEADVAIDDITLKPGACGTTQPTVVVPTLPTTPEPFYESEWDCNFEWPCKWHLDENGWTITNWNQSE